MEPVRRQIENGNRRVALHLRLSRSRRRNRFKISPAHLHLTGVVSEHGYEGQAHWLMFLFELTEKLAKLPPPHDEGRFSFFSRDALKELALPQTIANKSGRCSGGIAAVSSPRTAIAIPMATTTGSWKSPLNHQPSTINHPAMPDEPIIDLQSDHYFMGEALRQARRAYEAEEVPVGAVVVREGRIIARAFNQVELLRDATAHAEMLALTQAEEAVGDWRLADCAIYVTKEPCPMCAGAIVHVRLARLVFGASDPKGGAAGSALNLLQFPTMNHRCEITGGVREANAGRCCRAFCGAA